MRLWFRNIPLQLVYQVNFRRGRLEAERTFREMSGRMSLKKYSSHTRGRAIMGQTGAPALRTLWTWVRKRKRYRCDRRFWAGRLEGWQCQQTVWGTQEMEQRKGKNFSFLIWNIFQLSNKRCQTVGNSGLDLKIQLRAGDMDMEITV